MFRKVVGEEVTFIVCAHVDDLVMGDLSRYLRFQFERDKAKDVVTMTQTTFVDSLVERFDIEY